MKTHTSLYDERWNRTLWLFSSSFSGVKFNEINDNVFFHKKNLSWASALFVTRGFGRFDGKQEAGTSKILGGSVGRVFPPGRVTTLEFEGQ